MEDIENNVDMFEVSLDGNALFSALRAAAWHDAPLVRFPTRLPWTTSPLAVTVETMNHAGKITIEPLDLFNFFSRENFDLNFGALLKKRNALIRSGKDLLNEKERFFPHLKLK